MRCIWHHNHLDEPVLLYCEMNEQRWEQRKVEVFRNGHMAYGSKTEVSLLCAGLGLEANPSLEYIAKDPQFEPQEITKEEFEKIWAQALAQPRL